jgi:hypothetical protein
MISVEGVNKGKSSMEGAASRLTKRSADIFQILPKSQRFQITVIVHLPSWKQFGRI